MGAVAPKEKKNSVLESPQKKVKHKIVSALAT
jgi:hypothetical protein